MGSTITTEPATEPVTLEVAKAHLRVTHDDEDELIRTYLVASRRWVEEYTWRALVTQTWDTTIDDFPRSGKLGIILPRGRCTAINQITYFDTAGAQQTLTGPTSTVPGTDYQEDLSSDEGARIKPPIGDAWPDVEADRIAAVTIDLTVGYGDASAVPESIVMAVLYRLTDMYEFRGAVDGNGTAAAREQAAQYRLVKW